MGVLVLRKSAFSNACQYQLYPASRVAWIQATLLARYNSCYSNETFWKATFKANGTFARSWIVRKQFLLTPSFFNGYVAPVSVIWSGVGLLFPSDWASLGYDSNQGILSFMLQFFVAAVTIAKWTMIPFYLSVVLYVKSRLKLPKENHVSRGETHYRNESPASQLNTEGWFFERNIFHSGLV